MRLAGEGPDELGKMTSVSVMISKISLFHRTYSERDGQAMADGLSDVHQGRR